MNWQARQDELLGQLSLEVARFVRLALLQLERDNVFDAPGVIQGVIRKMRVADSDVIRSASARTERLLKEAFCLHRASRPIGA